MEAAAKLAEQGIEAEVLDLRTPVPLDWDAIVKTVSKTHNAIIVSEEVKRGSFAGELSAQIGEELFDELDAPVERVCGLNKSGNTVSFEAEKVLVAIGRKANTAALDLAAGKIDNDKGRILVNDKMETNVPGVYAIGDCVFGHTHSWRTPPPPWARWRRRTSAATRRTTARRPTPPACIWSRRRPPLV